VASVPEVPGRAIEARRELVGVQFIEFPSVEIRPLPAEKLIKSLARVGSKPVRVDSQASLKSR